MTTQPRSRRADILAAAEREFAAAGYAGGRVERIAARAGVNKQLLFHYFESKDGLFGSALAALLVRFEPPPSAADHPAEEIKSIVAALQDAVGALPGVLAIVADSTANESFPKAAADAVNAWRRRLRDRLGLAVEAGQARGYFRDDIDSAAVASLAFSAALGSGALDNGQSRVPIGSIVTDYCAWR